MAQYDNCFFCYCLLPISNQPPYWVIGNIYRYIGNCLFGSPQSHYRADIHSFSKECPGTDGLRQTTIFIPTLFLSIIILKAKWPRFHHRSFRIQHHFLLNIKQKERFEGTFRLRAVPNIYCDILAQYRCIRKVLSYWGCVPAVIGNKRIYRDISVSIPPPTWNSKAI